MKKISPQERRRFAQRFGLNEQYLYQCLTGRRNMSPAQATVIERKTGGELTRQMLCQGTYRSVWPELSRKG